MKATEIMIGDWVLHKWTKRKIKWKGSSYAIHYNGLLDVEPIPLTKEMLEANQIQMHKTWGAYFFCNDKKYVVISQDHDGGLCVRSTSISLRYVHELQHYLRLCGLNELAENFKI